MSDQTEVLLRHVKTLKEWAESSERVVCADDWAEIATAALALESHILAPARAKLGQALFASDPECFSRDIEVLRLGSDEQIRAMPPDVIRGMAEELREVRERLERLLVKPEATPFIRNTEVKT